MTDVVDVVTVLVLRSVFEKVQRHPRYAAWLKDAKDILQENPFSGEKVSRHLTPKVYKTKYNVIYVYRYRIPEAFRIIYILDVNKGIPTNVWIIDFLTHKEYERLFKY